MSDAISDFTMSGRDIEGSVQTVHGPIANVEMKYGIPTSDGGALEFQIDGEIHFAHDRSGWVDESEWWTNRKIRGLRAADGSITPTTESKITGNQTIQYTLAGSTYTWTRTSPSDWKIAAIETPSPTPEPAAVQTSPPDVGSNYQPASNSSDQSSGSAPAASAPQYSGSASCEEADVTAVYDDGKVLELDDGRHLRVGDADSVTSSVWVAPFDGMICDNGDRFINKDDNEAVDLQP